MGAEKVEVTKVFDRGLTSLCDLPPLRIGPHNLFRGFYALLVPNYSRRPRPALSEEKHHRAMCRNIGEEVSRKSEVRHTTSVVFKGEDVDTNSCFVIYIHFFRQCMTKIIS